MDRRDITEQLPNISAIRLHQKLDRREFLVRLTAAGIASATGTTLGLVVGSPKDAAKGISNFVHKNDSSHAHETKESWIKTGVLFIGSL